MKRIFIGLALLGLFLSPAICEQNYYKTSTTKDGYTIVMYQFEKAYFVKIELEDEIYLWGTFRTTWYANLCNYLPQISVENEVARWRYLKDEVDYVEGKTRYFFNDNKTFYQSWFRKHQ